MKKQQSESLQYFDKNALDWQNKSISDLPDSVNIIKQRNDYVLHILESKKNGNRFLDVGCGTGQLVIEASKMGFDATGVDFAMNMIETATSNARKEAVKDCTFVHASIFDYDMGINKYDVISANGFIEYIDLEHLKMFLKKCYTALKDDGILVFGSRNRLYNMFSLNEFTTEEIENGSSTLLLKEAISLVSLNQLNHENLMAIETAALQTDDTDQKNTGIDVSIRYQYTPVQLANLLNPLGMIFRTLHPVHIHGVSPSFKAQYPKVHASISNMLQEFSDDSLALLPYASSYMISASKLN